MVTNSVSFVPEVLDLDLYAGDTVSVKLVRKDSAGNPISLVGTYSSTITDATGVAQMQFSVNSSGAASGILYLELTAAQTQSLLGSSSYFRGKYDVQWTSNTAAVLTLALGGITCKKDISS